MTTESTESIARRTAEPSQFEGRSTKSIEAELKGTLTHRNLIDAFSREAQLCRLFQLFGRIAEIEGYTDAGKLLRELTETGEFLAAGHMDFLRRVADPLTEMPVGATLMNLASALASEVQDAQDYLPGMASTAHAEGFPDIASWFETLQSTKSRHVEKLRDLSEGGRSRE